MSYDDPDFQIRREHSAITTAGTTADSAKFRSFQAGRLKKVHAQLVTAGTASDTSYNVLSGTTSIGVISLLGSNTVGQAAASSGLLNADMASMGQFSVKAVGDNTAVANVVYEFEVLPSAVQS